MKMSQKLFKAKAFHVSWLFLGFVQLAALSACGVPGHSDALLQNTPESSRNSSSPTGSGISSRGTTRYSRLSLGFFDFPSTATLSLQSGGAEVYNNSSAVSWEIGPAQGAAPQSGARGDYRSHTGCESYAQFDGIQLCFQIQGDVSNVGLNSQEMGISGLASFISKNSDCTDSASDPVFVSAGSTGSSFETVYSVFCGLKTVTARLTTTKL